MSTHNNPKSKHDKIHYRAQNGGRLSLVRIKPIGLTPAQFARLANVPPEREWLDNIENEKTRRAYESDLHQFLLFAGLRSIEELRSVSRSHFVAWRKYMKDRKVAETTIRRTGFRPAVRLPMRSQRRSDQSS